ncbi:MAG: hypothetical protein GX557_11410 [Chloroflexi bacterium]|nr:hypothetical protein [Chloroflexota bacterium]
MARYSLTNRILLLLCWLTLLAFGAPVAAQSAMVQVAPAETSVEVGQELELVVRVDNISGMAGLELKLAFDPFLVALVDADEVTGGVQAQPGELPFPDLVLRNLADNEVGVIWYAVTQAGSRTPAAGSGTALTLRFRALEQGLCQISFDSLELVDAQGAEIETDRSGAVIAIGAGQTPAGPPPLPTAGPNGYPAPAEQTPTLLAHIPPDAPTPDDARTVTASATAQPQTTPTPSAEPLATSAETLRTASEGQTPEAAAGTPEAAAGTLEAAAGTPQPAAQEPEVAASVAPTAARAATAPDEPLYPLLPSEILLALGIVLLLLTVALFLYLTRRRLASTGRPRGRLS